MKYHKYLLIAIGLIVNNIIQDANAQNFCFTPTYVRGNCIPIGQCPELSSIQNRHVLYKDDIDLLKSSRCGNTADNTVCCPLDSAPTTSTTSPTPLSPITSPSTQDFDIANLLPAPGVCGEFISSSRLFLGQNASIFEHHWMALVEYLKPLNGRGFHCAGILITNKFVLSAAHCAIGTSIKKLNWRPHRVRLGEHNLATPRDCEGEDCSDDPVDIRIDLIINHEQYQPTSASQLFDISLFKLARSVPYTDWIKPACLPVAEHLKSINYDNHSLEAVGWGFTELGKRSDVKQKVRLNGINIDTCQSVYNQFDITLHSSQICALGEIRGNLQADTCSGDSGGPLMDVEESSDPQYMYVAGIVSFGPEECGTINTPGVYTRVSPYMDWILNIIRADQTK